MSQIPLSLRLDQHASFASFVAGSSSEAVEHVRAVTEGRRRELVWVFGASASGKTHLLTAACRTAGEAGDRAMYLDLASLTEPGLLDGLGEIDCLALDNVEAAAGTASLESALFAVLEGRMAGGGRLLMAARTAPRDCAFDLADLASRAASASVYRLQPLGDDDLVPALKAHAESRALNLDEPAARYLLTRLSRDLGELTIWLDRIDRFALAAQRRVTRPLIREVIAAQASKEASNEGGSKALPREP